MAYLTKKRSKYISIIRQRVNGRNELVAYIPLKTSVKSEAVLRNKLVQRDENLIKDGTIKKYQFKDNFEWLNEEGTSTLIQYSLSDAYEQFIKAHSVNVSESSIKRIQVTFNVVLPLWKKTTPIKYIINKHIEQFKEHTADKHSKAGINLNLRNIKTFLRWCVDNEMLDKMPKIVMVKEPKRLPKYINEKNMGKIIDKVESLHLKQSFFLYVTTGCRLSEIVEGTLEGKMLIVPAHISKSRIERRIALNKNQIKVLKEIHIKRDTHLLNGSQIKTFKDKYTKGFKDACRSAGLKGFTLHCLRHTFAVTQWIVSNDIYEVKNLLGHTSVKTTEKYARFTLDELKDDFPTAYKVRLEVEKVRKNGLNTPLLNTPFTKIEKSSSRNGMIARDC